MAYQIWIGADKDGRCLIGASKMQNKAVAVEKIYPSQMEYRVTAKRADGSVTVTTPNTAKQLGCVIIERFPRADGRLGRNAK